MEKRQTMRIMFDVRYIEDSQELLTQRDFIEALRDGLADEWWSSDRGAEWYVAAMYELEDDGTMMPVDPRRIRSVELRRFLPSVEAIEERQRHEVMVDSIVRSLTNAGYDIAGKLSEAELEQLRNQIEMVDAALGATIRLTGRWLLRSRAELMVVDEREWEPLEMRADQRGRWQSCEWCGSDQIQAGTTEGEDLHMWQSISCMRCEAMWTEVYEASHREMLEQGDPELKVTAWIPGGQG